MGRGAVDDSVKGVCGVCGALVFMATVIMVGCSFDTLDPLTAGIEFNSINKQIGTERAYTAGRYYLGLGREFLEFPMDFQLIEYSSASDADEPPLTARSDNVQLTLECSLQYTLMLDKLVTIYEKYQTGYHEKFVKIALSAIKNTAVGFAPADFYENRLEVGLALERAVRAALFRENAIVHDFQLRRVSLPLANEVAIIGKSISLQSQKTASHQFLTNRINADRDVIAGTEDALARVFQANRTREATVLVQQALARGTELKVSAQSSAYEYIKTELSFDTPELMRLLWLKGLRNIDPAAQVAVGFDVASVRAAG
mmetsp:Transcript_17201/g.40349  ORF Transcript_17201/g.40349 Transcript_17201/m.40349 type:complete len:314 (+) Transcript_17201:160-1101(+)